MSHPMASSLGIVAYLALFSSVAIVFLFVNLLVGRFVRPRYPHAEKLEVYECGEPTIGSSFVQFDLRFYVVALLFIIFDVEVAFFFPWAAVFGKSVHFSDPKFAVVDGGTGRLTKDADLLYRELGVLQPTTPTAIPASLKSQVAGGSREAVAADVIHKGFRQFALISLVDIAAFFGVLMVGFAYVWKRGDLDWVRALAQERAAGNLGLAGDESEDHAGAEPVLSA